LGAFYTMTVVNDRNGQIADLEDDVAALSGEQQVIAGQVTTLTTERDDARTTVADLEGDVGELERQLSQARGDASREQGRANNAEAIWSILDQVIGIDEQIHQQFGALVLSVGSRDWGTYTATVAELNRLFAQRDTLMGQLQ